MNSLEKQHAEMVQALAKLGQHILDDLTPEKCHLWHMASAAQSEAGELFDAIKKHIIYNKDLNRENVVEELGDLEFYLEGLREGLGITRNETLAANINKLLKAKNARYASGVYSDNAAQLRADKEDPK